jgi:hypothetical protein
MGEHAAHMGVIRNGCGFRPETLKIPLQKPRQSLKNNIKMNLKENNVRYGLD